MDADRLLARLCERRGLDPDDLRPYLPLVRRALISSDNVRRRILALVEDSLARRADGDESATLEALENDLDEEVLSAVARRLHGWSPQWKDPGTEDGLGPDDNTWPEGLGGGL